MQKINNPKKSIFGQITGKTIDCSGKQKHNLIFVSSGKHFFDRLKT